MKKNLFPALLMLALTVFGAGGAGTVHADEEPGTGTVSPVIDPDGADPFVLKTEDGYLYTKTTGSDVSLSRADSILKLGAAEATVVYRPEGALKDLWAPEIWNLDGCWYIYFAATVPGEEMHRMYVLRNLSEDPLQGTWECLPMEGMDDKFAIDGTILELDGKRYFIWSGWEGYENIRQDLYLAEMVSPTEVMDEKICLSTPEYPWERVGNPLVNEGPEILQKGDTVNLVYSASGSWTDDYCLGLLTIRAGEDPKDPENWEKHPQPILKKEGDVYGPGHNCFTVSPDGTQDLIIYHAARWKSAGWTRNVRFGYLDFDGSGAIAELHPVSANDLLPAPSGSGSILQIPLEDAVISDDLEFTPGDGSAAVPDGTIRGRWSGKSEMLLSIDAEEETEAVLMLTVRTFKTREGDLCTLGAKTDAQTTAACVYASESPQPVAFPVDLHPGQNTIRIYGIAGRADLEILRIGFLR